MPVIERGGKAIDLIGPLDASSKPAPATWLARHLEEAGLTFVVE